MIKLLPFLLLLSCVHGIKYEPDFGFLVSAPSNSPELPVMIDGYYCEDIAGRSGLCSVRIKQHKDLGFKLLPRQYNYRLHILCSSSVGFEKSFDVEKDKELRFDIPHEKYRELKSFTCIGEAFPKDRVDKVSAKFEVRVKVVDSSYIAREDIRLEGDVGDRYLILGRHSLFSSVFDGDSWKYYKKKTKVKVTDSESLRAYSESYSFRVNSYYKN